MHQRPRRGPDKWKDHCVHNSVEIISQTIGTSFRARCWMAGSAAFPTAERVYLNGPEDHPVLHPPTVADGADKTRQRFGCRHSPRLQSDKQPFHRRSQGFLGSPDPPPTYPSSGGYRPVAPRPTANQLGLRSGRFWADASHVMDLWVELTIDTRRIGAYCLNGRDLYSLAKHRKCSMSFSPERATASGHNGVVGVSRNAFGLRRKCPRSVRPTQFGIASGQRTRQI